MKTGRKGINGKYLSIRPIKYKRFYDFDQFQQNMPGRDGQKLL